MEEKENNLPEAVGQGAEAASPAEPPAVTEAGDTSAAVDATESTTDAVPADHTPEAPVESPVDEAAPPVIAADWQFGKRETPKPPAPTGNTKRFAGMFCGVVAVCLALLIALLFLGDAGIKIYRTITHERTVFVEGNNSSGGGESVLLAPEQAADLVKQSTVTVSVRTESGTGIGSGFVYTADGYICTNHHVIEDATIVQVILSDGETVDATVVGSDAMSDIAVLKINKTGLTPVKLGSSAAALVGEEVVAIGTPAKLDYAGTATFGKISYTNRIVSLTDESGVVTKKMTLLQTDASVNPGNSGGPLANMYGEVIGIVVMKVSYFGGTVFDGIGFAIPIDGAKTVIDAIIKDGKFEGVNPIATGRSLLGIGGIGILGGYWYSDPAVSDRIQSKTEVEGYTYIPYDGVYVIAVNEANAIDKLQVGDIITKINGLNMYTVYDVIDQVNRYPVNETVTVTLMRKTGTDYEQINVEIILLEE